MIISTCALDHLACVERYLKALECSDFDSIVALFGPQAMITSPLLGRVAPKPFYARMAEVTAASTVSRPELFVSASGERRAIGYFNYGWLLKDGTRVDFPCADVFEFARDGLISDLNIVYDTEPIRHLIAASAVDLTSKERKLP